MRSEKTFTAAAQTQDVDLGGARDVAITVTGAMTGTLTPTVSRDGGATYDGVALQKTDGTIVQAITAAGRFYPLGLTGREKLRITANPLTAGTPKAVIDAV